MSRRKDKDKCETVEPGESTGSSATASATEDEKSCGYRTESKGWHVASCKDTEQSAGNRAGRYAESCQWSTATGLLRTARSTSG